MQTLRSCAHPGECSRHCDHQADAQSQILSEINSYPLIHPTTTTLAMPTYLISFMSGFDDRLGRRFPNLLATISVPKAEELVATPYRHGTKEKAEAFFLDGMTQAMHSLAVQAHPAAPITIYYAFQAVRDRDDEGTNSTGWETFLEAVLKSGFRSPALGRCEPSGAERSVSIGTNALASSIILVCRPRDEGRRNDLTTAVRADAQRGPAASSRRHDPRERRPALTGRSGGPVAGDHRPRHGHLHPLRRRARSRRHADERAHRASAHQPLPRRGRLRRRHPVLPPLVRATRLGDGKFGEADTLARAKGTSVDGVTASGSHRSRRRESPAPEVVGVSRRLGPASRHAAARLGSPAPAHPGLQRRGRKRSGQGACRRRLARRRPLASWPTASTRSANVAGRAEDARAYNELITSWTGIESAAVKVPTTPQQRTLFDEL